MVVHSLASLQRYNPLNSRGLSLYISLVTGLLFLPLLTELGGFTFDLVCKSPCKPCPESDPEADLYNYLAREFELRQHVLDPKRKQSVQWYCAVEKVVGDTGGSFDGPYVGGCACNRMGVLGTWCIVDQYLPTWYYCNRRNHAKNGHACKKYEYNTVSPFQKKLRHSIELFPRCYHDDKDKPSWSYVGWPICPSRRTVCYVNPVERKYKRLDKI